MTPLATPILDCTSDLPAADLRNLAAHWARWALTLERAAGREPAPASWAAVDVAERHARGDATDAELAVAHEAALLCDAQQSLARDAAAAAAAAAAHPDAALAASRAISLASVRAALERLEL